MWKDLQQVCFSEEKKLQNNNQCMMPQMKARFLRLPTRTHAQNSHELHTRTYVWEVTHRTDSVGSSGEYTRIDDMLEKRGQALSIFLENFKRTFSGMNFQN